MNSVKKVFYRTMVITGIGTVVGIAWSAFRYRMLVHSDIGALSTASLTIGLITTSGLEITEQAIDKHAIEEAKKELRGY
jgi:hypothetical protein